MAKALKKMFFTRESMAALAERIRTVYSRFPQQCFLDLFFDGHEEDRELKTLMRHATTCLRRTLPGEYAEALEVIKAVAPQTRGFEAMALPDFVEQYGMDHWDLSLSALAFLTRYASAEFAIRPFLDQDPDRVIPFLLDLAGDENENVRRLASEGCRPRLPWAMALPKLKKDPEPILPILEKLKTDPSETVRRSVANNLNDISRDNPDVALSVCERWYGHTPETDAIIKHACRTLLKSGNRRALILFGYSDPRGIKISGLEVEPATVYIGDSVRFRFRLEMPGEKPAVVRLEYALNFVKAGGRSSRKVFMISEKSLKPGEHNFTRKHSFQDMTTRTHFPGDHRLTIIVNGREMSTIQIQVRS